jgi:hypothetical protein
LKPLAQQATREGPGGGLRYPQSPQWPTAVENILVRDHLYFFFRRVAVLEGSGLGSQTEEQRREQAERVALPWQTLLAADEAVEARLREGRAVVVLGVVLVVLAVALLVAGWFWVQNYRLRRRIQEMTERRVELARQYHAQRAAQRAAEPEGTPPVAPDREDRPS